MLILTPDGGYLHIPHAVLLSTPAEYLSAQYGITPEWIVFAQQLAEVDAAELAPAPSPPQPSRPTAPRSPRRPPRRPTKSTGRDHRTRKAQGVRRPTRPTVQSRY